MHRFVCVCGLVAWIIHRPAVPGAYGEGIKNQDSELLHWPVPGVFKEGGRDPSSQQDYRQTGIEVVEFSL